MPAPSAPTYSLGFTASSLRPELTRIIAEHFLEAGDWNATKARVLSGNALQARSAQSAIRMERELRQRIQCLTAEQLTLLAQSTSEDRAAMAWLAMLKYNTFVFEFASELLRDKLAAHDPVLRRSDVETFIETKAVAHPELTALKPSSGQKLRRVLLRMLFEAGLLIPGEALGIIHVPVLSPKTLRAVRDDNSRWLAGFLVTDAEIART